MNTNSFVRGILQIRVTALCLALVGLVVAEVGLGQSLAARIGQTTARQADAPQVPSVGIADMMAAAR